MLLAKLRGGPVISRSRILLVAVFAWALLSLPGCTRHASIADILRDPAQFAGKEVVISGQASAGFGGFGNGFFQMDDGTGKLWVMSQNFGIPAEGARVSLTGEVEQGIAIGGRSFGVVFRQTKPRE
jgi:hypothetical protein